MKLAQPRSIVTQLYSNIIWGYFVSEIVTEF